jgi:DNA excision repair protein ERCC-1
MEDEFDHDDAAFAAAALAIESAQRSTPAQIQGLSAAGQSTTPSSSAPAPKVVQPTPQALPSRHAPSAILVSTRQKGNPVLKNITAQPWEYADIPADFTLGLTTCALFLSLKYHRLHPEYIYSRIKLLQKNYNLRILLTMVDIDNHEASLRELAKTSLVNNLTLILCWSAREAARYLELYKSFENAGPGSIKARQGQSYAERMVEFATTVRSVNKADAVGLVSAFGSVRAAVNAAPEEINMVSGWGEKKSQRWCGTVREGFRVRRAGRRGIVEQDSREGLLRRGDSLFEDGEGPAIGTVGNLVRAGMSPGPVARSPIPIGRSPAKNSPGLARAAIGSTIPIGRIPAREASGLGQSEASDTPDADKRPAKRIAEEVIDCDEPGEDEEEALFFAMEEEARISEKQQTQKATAPQPTGPNATTNKRPDEPKLSDGVAAALAKLRQG